jgi:ABC-type xylose transport system substrate-binding protein
MQAMKLSRSITRISGLIAKSDGVALSVIDSMLQEGLDFSKYKLVEI